MSSILKVDTIQTTAGAAPTTKDLGFAAGSVIQVVSAALSSGVSYSTLTETNVLTLNITPKFNTSKILILANFGLYLNSSAAQDRGDFIIRRDTTLIRGRDDGSGVGHFRDSSGHFKSYMAGFNHLDSPATTNAITYKMAYKGHTYAVGGTYQEDNTNMTLMEIAQ